MEFSNEYKSRFKNQCLNTRLENVYPLRTLRVSGIKTHPVRKPDV